MLRFKPFESTRNRLGVFVTYLVAAASMAAGGNVRANTVTDWNSKAATALQSELEHSRPFAMVQLAVHDALNAVDARYARYAFHGTSPAASPDAAVASAAHDVLAALVPAKRAELDAWLEQSLAAVGDQAAREAGVIVGAEAAKATLAARAGDDVQGALFAPYTPGSDPGDYQATPPHNVALGAGWGKLKTFVLPSCAAFRPAAPPALTSRRYTRDYQEVKELGSRDSRVRTAEQTEIATFWYELSPLAWLRLTNKLAVQNGKDMWESARLLALVSAALADGFIAGMEAKYHYAYWRPITAIRLGDGDGNRFTRGDAAWAPQCDTPPVPDYPSTHSLMGGAAAMVLARIFGENTSFEADSTSLPGVVRTFKSFGHAARENAESRVYCGIHWRTSIEHGLRQGRHVGAYVASHGLPALR